MAEEPPTKRKCLGVGCENEATSLQCPKCLSLGIKDSYFCSQDCFKKNWVRREPLAPPPRNQPWDWADLLTAPCFRPRTRMCTSKKTVFSTTSSLQRSSLNQIQKPATTIRSRPLTSPDLCDPCTRSPRGAKCPSRYRVPTTPRMAFPSPAGHWCGPTRSSSWTPRHRMPCARSAG